MTDAQRLPYRVQGWHMTGSRASLCATPGRALQRLHAYRKAHYRDIAVLGPDGTLTETDLRRLIIENAKRLIAAPAFDPYAYDLEASS